MPDVSVVQSRETVTITPVKVWALVGAGFLAVEAFAIIGWFVTGNAKPTDPGPDPVPAFMRIAGNTWSAVGLVATVFVLWRFVFQPLRRDRHLTTDGIFCLVFLSLCWQDVLQDYFKIHNTYNAGLPNLGSFYGNVPGWVSPHGNYLPWPILFAPACYVYLLFVSVVLLSRLMHRARQRFPSVGNVRLIAIAFAGQVLAFGIIEPQVLRLGINVYPGAIRSVSLFAGHYYQYPLYELVMLPLVMTGWTCVRFFVDDRGYTVAERGIEEFKLRGWAERRITAIRFLALAGICNTLFIVLYNLPMSIIATHSDPWPADFMHRSYLTDGYCTAVTTPANSEQPWCTVR